MSSTKKLVAALQDLDNVELASIIQKAGFNYYHETKTEIPFPFVTLVLDILIVDPNDKELRAFCQRVRDGEFAATSQEWAQWEAEQDLEIQRLLELDLYAT